MSFVGLSTGKAIVDSADFPANRGWELHEAVEAAATMPDEACVGNWCGGCYQRHYCHAWQARVQTGAALMLAPKGGDFAITSETAPALFERIADIRKAADMAEEILRAEILAGTVVCEIDGKRLTPVQTAGRKSPDIDALLAAGVDVPMKQGKNYVTWKMLKVKS